MEEKQILSAEESLEIIENMIIKAKNTMADNSFLFLLWGWLSLVACIGQFVLKYFFGYTHHYYVWALLFVALGITIFKPRKEFARGGAKTYVDYTIENLWTMIIVSYIMLTIIFFIIDWRYCYTFYILLMSTGCFLTGKLLNFYPLVAGAVICWGLVLLTTLVNFDNNILIGGLAVIISYLIPGYLLRARYRNSKSAAGDKPLNYFL